MPRRGLVVLISDLFYAPDEVFSGLDHLQFHGHDLLVFHVLDPIEHGLPLDGQVRFHDLETGEDVITQVEEIRAAYAAAVASWCGELDRGSVGRGIDRVALTSDHAPGSGPVRLPDETRRDVLTRLRGAITVASGLGLIHPGFLAAGLAVAVPIVIHLLLRQKARQVEIGSLHFLQGGPPRPGSPPQAAALDPAGPPRGRCGPARCPLHPAPTGARSSPARIRARSSCSSIAPPAWEPGGKGRPRGTWPGSEPGRSFTRFPAGTALHLGYFDANGVTPASPGDLDASGSVNLAATDFGPALSWARDLALAAGKTHCRVYLLSDLQRSGIRRPLENPLPEKRDRSPSWTSVVRSLATWPWATSRPSKPSFVREPPSPSRHGSSTQARSPRVRSASRSRWMASRPSSRRSIWSLTRGGSCDFSRGSNNRASTTEPSASSERTIFRPTIVAGSPSRRGAPTGSSWLMAIPVRPSTPTRPTTWRPPSGSACPPQDLPPDGAPPTDGEGTKVPTPYDPVRLDSGGAGRIRTPRSPT